METDPQWVMPTARTLEFIAYLDTDLGGFRLKVDLGLIPPENAQDADEVEFRARQLLDLFRIVLEAEARRIGFLNSVLLRKQIT